MRKISTHHNEHAVQSLDTLPKKCFKWKVAVEIHKQQTFINTVYQRYNVIWQYLYILHVTHRNFFKFVYFSGPRYIQILVRSLIFKFEKPFQILAQPNLRRIRYLETIGFITIYIIYIFNAYKYFHSTANQSVLGQIKSQNKFPCKV